MTAAPPAPAASVDRPCYYRTDARSGSSDVVRVTASGLTPGSPYTVRVAGRELRRKRGAPATTDAVGRLSVRVASPHIGLGEKAFTLSVRAGITTAQTRLRVTAFDAVVAPLRGDPRRPVRVRLLGWLGRTVYLHYLPPRSRRARRTIRVTRTHGPCGHATVRVRHLFPFRPRAGTWRLRFDTRRTYARSSPFFVDVLSTVSLF